MYEITVTLINHHMLILSSADSTLWELSQVFCPLNVAVTVMQSWTGSSRNGSSINMCLYKLKYSFVLHTLEAYLHLFLTLALDGGQWAASHLGIIFFVERTLLCIEWEVGWAPEPVWLLLEMRKIFSHYCESNSSSLVQLIAYCCVILGIQNWKTKISKLF